MLVNGAHPHGRESPNVSDGVDNFAAFNRLLS
jgi:hypothetical protein